MKIKILRDLLKNYEQERSPLQKILYTEPEIINNLRQFIKSLDSWDENNHLLLTESYSLFKIMMRHAQDALVAILKPELAPPEFFQLCAYLSAHTAIDESLFSRIYAYPMDLIALLIPLLKMQDADVNFFISLLDKIFALSSNDFNRLLSILRLFPEGCDNSVLSHVLNIVSAKLPVAKESVVQITSDPINQGWINILIDQKEQLYLKKYAETIHGGFGEIKKGYVAPQSPLPSYAIKQLTKVMIEPGKDAKREVKYNRLLGRKAHFFNVTNQAVLVYEWQSGKSLYEFARAELLNISFVDRIRLLHSAFLDLNKLHHIFRVHGDIKALNFIVDKDNKSMHLIDFGSSRKLYSNPVKLFSHTSSYADPGKTSYSLVDDMYAMSIVTAMLFPDLFHVVYRHKKKQINVNKLENLSILEEAILLLTTRLADLNRGNRCTCEEASQYCQFLIEEHADLTRENWLKIQSQTFNRLMISEEETIRGCTRSSLILQ